MNTDTTKLLTLLHTLKAKDLPLNASDCKQIADAALVRDRHWLLQQHKRLATKPDNSAPRGANSAEKWLKRARLSLDTVVLRAQALTSINYPSVLPISASIAEIKSAILQHQVIIVAGETGSGKTTQLPKICAELGFGIRGRIGHTQPRRLAARTVAARIADELDVVLGQQVGYQFRFNAQCDNSTRIKLMTDGILLAEISNDRYLNEYDVIIIDEAHERSLNIDFLLGYLKILLPKRPDLKLIVTSATIDVERFSAYFNDAPVLSIEGRSYPVSVEYIDLDMLGSQAQATTQANKVSSTKNTIEPRVDDLPSRVAYALDLIQSNAKTPLAAHDVLVFLPGEREIREVSKSLRKDSAVFEVLPLYSRLSQAEQQKIFSTSAQHKKRRVVLATNVAETSVTVPGIGYVIDAGLARLSRYSARSKLQRLPIEAISKASANQRAGRCGRIAAGVCYRLYSEDDFLQRDEFTEPEIRRTNLASVILQMKHMGLGEIEQFPFIDAPDTRQVRSGVKILQELSAVSASGELTALGKKLARMPVDPKLGRMLLAAQDKNCMAEMLIIVSALAVQDPRETPADKRQAADMAHRRFWHPQSDFMVWLNLWHYIEQLRESLSQRQFRTRCKREFLSFSRLREWRDVHWQLRLAVKSIGRTKLTADDGLAKNAKVDSNATSKLKREEKAGQKLTNEQYQLDFTAVEYEHIHRAVLTGIPLNIGKKEHKGLYRGGRELQFFLFPGSSQFKPAPAWVLAGDIVETQKVYARSVAAIDPIWVAKELSHLTKLQYSEPFWHKKRGQVVAKQTTLFYGLVVEANTHVDYENIDVAKSRQIFIQQALVQQGLSPDERLSKLAKFWQKNLALIKKVQKVEEKLRRRDLLVDDDHLFHFYDKHLPEQVCSRVSLTQWINGNPTEQQALCLTEHDILLDSDNAASVEQFPDHFNVGVQSFTLKYCFSPGNELDGVTASIPLGVLNILPIDAFDWLVPGMLLDKCIDMLKLLPKAQRKHLVPVPDTAKKLLSKMDVGAAINNHIPLVVELAKQIHIYHNVSINIEVWRAACVDSLDNYDLMRFEIIDLDGSVLGQGRDLLSLQQDSMQQLDKNISHYAEQSFQQESITSWSFGELAEVVNSQSKDTHLSGYPTLLDKETSVTLALSSTVDESNALTRQGLIRLAMLAMKDKLRYLRKNLCQDTLTILPFIKMGSRDNLVEDIIKAAIASSCFNHFSDPLPRNKQAFEQCLADGKSQLIANACEIELVAKEALGSFQKITTLLKIKRVNFSVLCGDVDKQLEKLIYVGFLQTMGNQQLQHLPRYMKALVIRLERMGGAAKKEQELCEKLLSLEQPLQNLLYKYPYALVFDSDVAHFRWLLEELRVSLFAQQLKTAVPVSFQRANKAWGTINLNRYPLSR